MLTRLPSTKALYAFVVTAEELNFTAAANRLNLTQGAVSRQILSLEQLLGIALFHRHARGLSLTSKGTEFLPLVEHTLNHLQHSIEHIAHDKRKIKLKVPSCITSWLLPRLMNFQQQNPEIDVELTSTINHSVNFTSEPFDAAIGYGDLKTMTQQDNHLQHHLLFEEILTPVCAPSIISDQEEIATSWLEHQTWLHATPGKSDWKLWLKAWATEQEQPEWAVLQGKKNQHFATLDLSVNAAIQGFGIAIGDTVLAKPDIELGKLIAPCQFSVRSGKGYFFIRPKAQVNSNIERLMTELLN
ncbi:LysR substrate-binding domain-containing protein [Vibrio rumoiensis]|uniref:LysR substrate-binding domain-containing protein n=1 Tax=Vibrio rumoiensis TaxID=76258 RepID=A0ABW7J0G4_9VIBR|nr:LysR substrate-binding domain-containing protein [Vibrio rumoiensis]